MPTTQREVRRSPARCAVSRAATKPVVSSGASLNRTNTTFCSMKRRSLLVLTTYRSLRCKPFFLCSKVVPSSSCVAASTQTVRKCPTSLPRGPTTSCAPRSCTTRVASRSPFNGGHHDRLRCHRARLRRSHYSDLTSSPTEQRENHALFSRALFSVCVNPDNSFQGASNDHQVQHHRCQVLRSFP